MTGEAGHILTLTPEARALFKQYHKASNVLSQRKIHVCNDQKGAGTLLYIIRVVEY